MRRAGVRLRRTATSIVLAGALAVGAAACEDTPLEDDIEQDIQEGVEDIGEGAEDLVDDAGSELEDLTGDDEGDGTETETESGG